MQLASDMGCGFVSAATALATIEKDSAMVDQHTNDNDGMSDVWSRIEETKVSDG